MAPVVVIRIICRVYRHDPALHGNRGHGANGNNALANANGTEAVDLVRRPTGIREPRDAEVGVVDRMATKPRDRGRIG